MNRHPNLRNSTICMVICQSMVAAWRASAPPRAGAQEAVWRTFKERFLQEDGRVVDDLVRQHDPRHPERSVDRHLVHGRCGEGPGARVHLQRVQFG